MSRSNSAAAEATAATGAGQAPSALPVWFQKVVQLPGVPRGCHVVTRQILQQLPEIQEVEVGLANLFIQVSQ